MGGGISQDDGIRALIESSFCFARDCHSVIFGDELQRWRLCETSSVQALSECEDEMS